MSLADFGFAEYSEPYSYEEVAKPRHRKFKIVKGRKMRWNSKYQGYEYVPSRKGKRTLTPKQKLTLIVALMSQQGKEQGSMLPLLMMMGGI